MVAISWLGGHYIVMEVHRQVHTVVEGCEFPVYAIIVMPDIFLTAELFWRLEINLCGKFTRWVERKFISVIAIAELKSNNVSYL